MSKYIINVSFQTRVNKTTRTLEIAESFGLGLDEKEWTLYDNLELEVKQGDVVYITGQSGSGKSVVLRELQRQMKDEGLSVASIDDFTFDNEVSRMHDRPIIEIQSSMSKYNPFAMKAGFKFIRPERPKSYESALRVFQRHFRSDPGDNEAIVKELFAMSESRRRRALRDLVADYHKNSSLAKAGRNRGTTIQDIADSLVDEASIVKLLKDIHNLSFTSPLYGVYRNPDFGRRLPDTLPLLAFDKQPLDKPLEIALPA